MKSQGTHFYYWPVSYCKDIFCVGHTCMAVCSPKINSTRVCERLQRLHKHYWDVFALSSHLKYYGEPNVPANPNLQCPMRLGCKGWPCRGEACTWLRGSIREPACTPAITWLCADGHTQVETVRKWRFGAGKPGSEFSHCLLPFCMREQSQPHTSVLTRISLWGISEMNESTHLFPVHLRRGNWV